MAKTTAAKSSREDALPHWDLTDLYPAPDAPEVGRDLAAAEKKCAAFAASYQEKLLSLDAKGLAGAIKQYEEIQELLGKLGSYAQLKFAEKMDDPIVGQFYQNIQEKLTAFGTHILFFTLGINKIEDGRLQIMLQDKNLAAYAPWIRDVRSFLPYQLSDDLEKLLFEKSLTSSSAWIRLFDETLTAMRVKIGAKALPLEQALNRLSSKKSEERKEAALAIGEAFKAQVPTFTLVTNTLAKDKEIEDRWRNFPRPISSRNLANYIEDDVVDALISAVKGSYPRLSHRYYALKASWFGKKKLDYWDRNAPLPSDSDRKFTWPDASELVLTAYRNFSPELATIGKLFFDKNWIDVPARAGKATGAFAHPTVPSAHPYLLLNYQGKSRDVMTLAHELGHGVHQVLSAKQGALMADTPLTLAETASVFGEQLAFQEMLRREKSAARRKILIAGKVEDMLNTVVRQIAFCEFERKLHDARRQSELTAEQISELWLEVQGESLGPALKLHGNYRYYWTYISHFIHSPFYVYAYAFGDCLVNSLYAVYTQEAARGKQKDFEKKYLAMLEAGGTLRHKELLAPFGLDATKADFWQQGLDLIAGMIDELEE